MYVATANRDAPAAIQGGLKTTTRRETLHKIADAVRDPENVGYRVTIFFVPGDRNIRVLGEVRTAPYAATTENSKPTLRPSERVRERSGVLRLIDEEQSRRLYLDEDDVRVKLYTWKMDRALSGRHTLRLYGVLSSDEASTLVQEQTEHYAYLFRKKLAENPRCKCGRDDETVLHVLL